MARDSSSPSQYQTPSGCASGSKSKSEPTKMPASKSSPSGSESNSTGSPPSKPQYSSEDTAASSDNNKSMHEASSYEERKKQQMVVVVKESISKKKRQKRKAEEEEEKDDDEYKPESAKQEKPFQKIWSDEDELILLSGMVAFSTETNSNPLSNNSINDFLDFIKKSLHFNVTKPQLMDKARRLKKKFLNNYNNGKSPSNAHEKKCFQLSKALWFVGCESKKVEKNKSCDTSKALCGPPSESGKGTPSASAAAAGPNICLRCQTEMVEMEKSLGFELADTGDNEELAEELKEIQVADLMALHKRCAFVMKQVELKLKSLQSELK